MSTRLDPTRTTLIRRQFSADMRRRFRALRREVSLMIVEDDALGLTSQPLFTPLANVKPLIFRQKPDGGVIPLRNARQIWRFKTDDEKLDAFREWFQDRIDDKVLSVKGKKADPWLAKYVESAYKKGNLRAYLDSIPGKRAKQKGPGFFDGSYGEFLRSAFGQPEQVKKVRHLATRTFEELRGVTASMASKMNTILSDGIVQGQNPKTIARAMAKNIEGVSKQRALTIARTEVVHAHAEGQLDSFEDLGIEEVGVYAEWSTAEDDDVCPLCEPLEGAIFKVKEARGKLPRHPNCRCAWVPATDVKTKHRRQQMIRKVSRSVKEEGGKSKSTWAGKSLRYLKKKAK